MEMVLTRFQCHYRLHTASRYGTPHYPQIFTYKCVPSISMTCCCMTVIVHVVLSFLCVILRESARDGHSGTCYTQSFNLQLMTDHVTTLLNYQWHWDHSLTGSCIVYSIQSNITSHTHATPTSAIYGTVTRTGWIHITTYYSFHNLVPNLLYAVFVLWRMFNNDSTLTSEDWSPH